MGASVPLAFTLLRHEQEILWHLREKTLHYLLLHVALRPGKEGTDRKSWAHVPQNGQVQHKSVFQGLYQPLSQSPTALGAPSGDCRDRALWPRVGMVRRQREKWAQTAERNKQLLSLGGGPVALWGMNDGLYAAVGPADQGLGPRKEGMTELLSHFPPDQTWLR